MKKAKVTKANAPKTTKSESKRTAKSESTVKGGAKVKKENNAKVKKDSDVGLAAEAQPGVALSAPLVILSSAKTLDFTTAISDAVPPHTRPMFIKEATQLITLMRSLSRDQVMKSMRVSAALAKLNVDRFASWKDDGERCCLCAYMGGVYKTLDAQSFDQEDWTFAQECLRIVSGLYGLLRPLDLISPYRLEMAVKVKGASSNDSLYDFWRERVTMALPSEGLLVNLASVEYSSTFDQSRLGGLTWVDVDFRESNGRIVAVHAKAARGLMARYIVKKRCVTLDDLGGFNLGGYELSERDSTPGASRIKLTFTRSKSSTSASTL